MRTTLDIRDDVLEQVKQYAAARSISNGAAVTEILQKGLTTGTPTRMKHGLTIFDPSQNAEVITLERSLQFEHAMEDEPF